MIYNLLIGNLRIAVYKTTDGDIMSGHRPWKSNKSRSVYVCHSIGWGRGNLIEGEGKFNLICIIWYKINGLNAHYHYSEVSKVQAVDLVPVAVVFMK
jgi:hypothetical protein